MGSFHPPNDISPFGYQFGSFIDGSSESVPSGAQPLLDDVDQNTLDNFFDTTDPFDSKVSFVDPNSQGKPILDRDFQWPYQPPPSVQGVSTTVASNFPHTNALGNAEQQNHFTMNQGIHTADIGALNFASEEDRQAASALQIFTSHQVGLTPFGRVRGGIPGQGVLLSLQSLEPNVEPASAVPTQYPTVSATTSPLGANPTSNLLQQTSSYNRPQNGSGAPSYDNNIQDIPTSRTNLLKSYQFGSDSNFNSNGYVRPPGSETADTVTRRLETGWGEIFAPPSTDTTRPPSPVTHRHIPGAGIVVGLLNNNNNNNSITSGDSEEEEGEGEGEDGFDVERGDTARPAKRRKSMPKPTNSPSKGSHDPFINGKSGSKRLSPLSGTSKRSYKGPKENDENASSGGKKPLRMSQKQSAAKQARANLTEEEKRSNHILSEQKRRNLIKQGFEDLNYLMPGLRNGGLSKSAVLVESANFLESLIKGNNELKEILGMVKKEG